MKLKITFYCFQLEIWNYSNSLTINERERKADRYRERDRDIDRERETGREREDIYCVQYKTLINAWTKILNIWKLYFQYLKKKLLNNWAVVIFVFILHKINYNKIYFSNYLPWLRKKQWDLFPIGSGVKCLSTTNVKELCLGW